MIRKNLNEQSTAQQEMQISDTSSTDAYGELSHTANSHTQYFWRGHYVFRATANHDSAVALAQAVARQATFSAAGKLDPPAH